MTENIQRHSWSGRVTIEKLTDIAAEIERRLSGKRFTVVDDAPGMTLSVHTSQRFWSGEEPTQAGISNDLGILNIRTSCGMFHFRTTLHHYDMFSSDDDKGLYVHFDADKIRIVTWTETQIRTVYLYAEEACDDA